MKSIKFLVKVDRGGTRAPEYVQQIDLDRIQMTTNPKLALLMGKFTAEDAAKSIHTSRRSPELVPVGWCLSILVQRDKTTSSRQRPADDRRNPSLQTLASAMACWQVLA